MILTVGLLLGIGVGIAACVTAMGSKASAPAVQVTSAPAPVPSLVVDPAQGAPVSAYAAATVPPQFDQSFQPSSQPAMLIAGQQYTQDVTAVSNPFLSTDGYSSTTTISAGNINPNWTIGRNGLIQNPCVDPPSAHGRATGQY